MRTYSKIRLWIAVGIFFMTHGILMTGGSAQSGSDLGGKDSGSKNTVRSGINVSEFTDVNALGFMALQEVTPWGHLVADETEKMMLARDDTVYLAIEKGHDAKPGDLFTVYESLPVLDNPLTGKGMGYVISYLGRVVLKTEVKPHVFRSEIVESYRPMQVGDPVLPFQPVSPCIQLSSPKLEPSDPASMLRIPVVAAKDLTRVIGQFSVLYLNHGHKHGVHRGNLFQIVARGEPDQPPDPTLPDQAIGYVVILEARPDTSTGLVITAKNEFYTGTVLKALDFRQALINLLKHYGMEQDDAGIETNPLQVLARLKEELGSRTDLPEELLLLSKLPSCPIP